jgi:hypothetical protein
MIIRIASVGPPAAGLMEPTMCRILMGSVKEIEVASGAASEQT